MYRRAQTLLPAVVIIAMTSAAYLPAIQHGGFVWDDKIYITENPHMDSLDGLGMIWTGVFQGDYIHQYYPLTSTVFWIQHQLYDYMKAIYPEVWWGKDAMGYHVVNVLLHAANAFFLWQLLRLLNVPGAWIAAAIFAIHPVHVQSVAWITELKNVLSTLFYLSSALVFVRFFRLHQSNYLQQKIGKNRLTWLTYILGLFLFVCALLSKTATASLPVALLLLMAWKRRTWPVRDLMHLAPIMVIGAGFILATSTLESHYTSLRGDPAIHSLTEKILISGRSICFYASKLVWPESLAMIYPRWQINARIWWQYLFPVGVLLATTALWIWRNRIGKGPVAAVAFFIIAVAPVSFATVGFTQHSYVADHWQYWASMGLITLAVSTATVLSRCGGIERWISCLAVGIVLVSFSTLTYQQAAIYESPEKLWANTVAKNPDAWSAHNILGRIDRLNGDIDSAIKHYFEAAGANPDALNPVYNLGEAFSVKGDIDKSMYYYRAALKIQSDDALTHNNLANLLFKEKRVDGAIDHYRKAIEADPDYVDALCNLGNALAVLGQLDNAVTHYLRAVKLDPDYARAHFYLGRTLLKQGRIEKGQEHLNEATRLEPKLPSMVDQLEAKRNHNTPSIPSQP